MSVQLTNIRTNQNHGSGIDDLLIHRSQLDTRVDVSPYDNTNDGLLNVGYVPDTLPQYNGESSANVVIAVDTIGMGLRRVMKVAELRTDKIDDENASLSNVSINSTQSSLSTSKKSVYEEAGCCSRNVPKIQSSVNKFCYNHGDLLRHTFYAIFILGYAGYFAWALNYEFGTESSIRLLWMTMLVVVLIIITLVRDNFGDEIYQHVLKPPVDFVKRHYPVFKWCFIACVAVGYVIFLIVDVGLQRPEHLVSLLGIAIFVLLMFIFSKHPSKVRWRTVIWGMGLQFVFGLIVLRTTWGYEAFEWLGDRVQEFMLYSDEGAKFVFGDNFMEHFFAFKVLPVIIFFSSVISVLYYLGVMQSVIGKISWAMQRTMGTTAAESTNAAGNIFIGNLEAPLLVRPMMKYLTQSELHAVMVGGFATIAGGVMATYIAIGVPATHLISASIMAAPCALAISKLFYPETEKPDPNAVSQMEKSPHRNIIEAASAGASSSIGPVANIAANFIAFISILAFINTTLTWMGHRAGLWPPQYEELTFELICSYVFWPFAWLMGVPSVDCRKVGELIGLKTFINEFVAYTELGTIIENSEYYSTYNGTVEYISGDMYLVNDNITLYGGVMEERSITISTYALCGFANIGALGSAVGFFSSMVPDRAHEISTIGIRAVIAGTIVSFINACVAGLLYDPATI